MVEQTKSWMSSQFFLLHKTTKHDFFSLSGKLSSATKLYSSWQNLHKAHDWSGAHCQPFALYKLLDCGLSRWSWMVDVFLSMWNGSYSFLEHSWSPAPHLKLSLMGRPPLVLAGPLATNGFEFYGLNGSKIYYFPSLGLRWFRFILPSFQAAGEGLAND